MNPRFVDLTGKHFDKWKVLERAPDKGKNRYWLCECECGTIKIVGGRHLVSGASKSCGCSFPVGENAVNFKHGDRASRNRLYKIWCEMKARCLSQNNSNYKRYGSRGISICEEWLHDYTAFKAWALSHGYADNLTIERMDNDGNYCPENCKWATPKEQANNRRTTRKFEYQGVVLSIKGHCERLNLNRHTVSTRLSRDWTFEEAITGKRKKGNDGKENQ